MMLTYLIDRRNKATTPWTPERDAQLTQLWADGYSASQIVEQMCDVRLTRSAVIGRAHRMKLPARRERHLAKIKPKPQRTHRFQPPPLPTPRPRPVAAGAPTMRRLSLIELMPSSCRYPLGEWNEKATLFCGADAPFGEVYCDFHHRLACSHG